MVLGILREFVGGRGRGGEGMGCCLVVNSLLSRNESILNESIQNDSIQNDSITTLHPRRGLLGCLSVFSHYIQYAQLP